MCASDAILWNAYRSFLARGGCSLKVVGWSFCNTSAEPAFSIHSFNSYWFVVFQSAGPLLNSVWMRLLQLCVSIYDSGEAQSQASSLESGRAELFHHKDTKRTELVAWGWESGKVRELWTSNIERWRDLVVGKYESWKVLKLKFGVRCWTFSGALPWGQPSWRPRMGAYIHQC